MNAGSAGDYKSGALPLSYTGDSHIPEKKLSAHVRARPSVACRLADNRPRFAKLASQTDKLYLR
jgi:hypothetical protein